MKNAILFLFLALLPTFIKAQVDWEKSYVETILFFEKAEYVAATELTDSLLNTSLFRTSSLLNQFRFHSLNGLVATQKERFEVAKYSFERADSLIRIAPTIKKTAYYPIHLNNKSLKLVIEENLAEASKNLQTTLQTENLEKSSRLRSNLLLGKFHLKKNQLDSAENYLLRASDLVFKKDTITSILEASLSNQIGYFFYNKSLYPEALEYLNQASVFCKKQQLLEHPEYANTLNYLALVKIAEEEFVQAEPYLDTAIAINQFHQLQIPLAYNWSNLSMVYEFYGDLAQAKVLKDKALAIFKERQLYSDYCINLFNQGYLYDQMDSIALAINAYREVKDLSEEKGLTNTLVYASAYKTLADYYGQDNKVKADSFYQIALEIAERVVGQKNDYYTYFLNDYAIFLQESDSLDKAKFQFLQVATINKELLGENHPSYVDVLFQLATLYEQTEDYPKANEYYEQGIKGQILLAQHHYSQLDEESRLYYIKNIFRYNLFRYYSFVCQKYTQPESIKNLQYVNLSVKNLALDYYLDFKKILDVKGSKKDSSLFNNIQQKKEQLSQAYLLSEREKKEEAINVEQLKLETERMERQLYQQLSLQKEEQVLTFDALHQKLKATEVAIDYISFYSNHNEFVDTILYYAILTSPDLEHPVLKYIGKEVDIANSINNFTGEGLPLYIAYPQKGYKLYQQLFQPFTSYLRDSQKIYISTSRLLSRVAFGALPITENLDFTLAQKHEISYYVSLRNFLNEEQIPIKSINSSKTTIALFGGAEFQEKAEDTTSMRTSFQNLPGTLVEVKAIEKALPLEDWQPKLYIKKAASEENFKQLAQIASPNVLHVATHGYFFNRFTESGGQTHGSRIMNSTNPFLRSGILFTGADISWRDSSSILEGEDGILTALEISLLDLRNTDLAVLSACETAMGDILFSSEGVHGLQRAFKLAGVNKMVISLWKVPDDVTADLMIDFYTYYLQGFSVSKSLHQAQMKLARDGYSALDWGAFIVLE